MKKFLAIALTAATLVGGSAAVSAQSLDIGPGGPRIDLRSDRERAREREFRREERERERDRRSYRDRGEGRCREVTVRERDSYGNVEVTRRRECR
jgi:Ni/Co efflux regulator RcnB